MEAHRFEERAVTDALDVDRPNLARATDYLFGGGANFAADRAAVQELLANHPGFEVRLQAARTFVARAVREALARGHDQFVDLGSGIPSVGALHTSTGYGTRVVYVDVDPVAVAHTRESLLGAWTDAHVAVRLADLRDVGTVLAEAAASGLDLQRPVTLVCNSVLQWLTTTDTEDLAAVFAAYRTALAPGSLLVLSLPHADLLPHYALDEVVPVIEQSIGPVRLRRRAEVETLIAGWDVLDPGLVDVTAWPGPSGAEPAGYYAVVCASRP
ncbi:SAM-dependent methyltransferase [Actinomycetospora atypica]|uniref:SAM-dependent methyltransferase n=1 Tax=Actinomycetospora atypica TaxID=1290095 RepID=A0ABV9YL28_9PSEU